VVTPLGWTVVALAPLSLAAGFAWGWAELILIGTALATLALVALVYLIGRLPISVQITPPHNRIAVGDDATAGLVITNSSNRRTVGVGLDVPVGEALVTIDLPGLSPAQQTERSVTIPTARRGRFQLGPVRTVRADPIGLVRRELTFTDPIEFIVHPRTIDIPSTSSGLVRDLEGQSTRDLTPSDLSFHALREYAPGDDRRHIHWKSTAKTGTFMVRQFEETRRSHLVVVLSLASADFASGGEFELAVSAAGSLGARAIRDARDISVVVSALTPEYAKRTILDTRNLSTLTPGRLLDDLAVVDPTHSALGLVDTSRLAGSAVRGISVAFLVIGSSVPISRLRSAAAAFPPSVEVIAIQCDPERIPGMRRVSGMGVVTIGSLADLRRAMRGGTQR
jgi:uncharacterized protein (DUF58 family)